MINKTINKLINGELKTVSDSILTLDMKLSIGDMKVLESYISDDIYKEGILDITEFVVKYLSLEEENLSDLYKVLGRPLRSVALEVKRASEEGYTFYTVEGDNYFKVELSKDKKDYILSFYISHSK